MKVSATKKRQIVLLMWVLILAIFVAKTAEGSQWLTFVSSRNFSVKYPPTWRLMKSKDGLFRIINYPPSQNIKGLLIPSGGAVIVAYEENEHHSSLSEWIRSIGRFGAVIVSRKVIELPTTKSKGCNKLIKIVDKANVGLPADVMQTRYYCAIKKRLFLVGVSNWEGNVAQKKLQKLGLRIALSLQER